ncbi:MAG: S8 family serine peptidase, partial [Anaerolineaceae bacterium]|nr:S8 family serine peptidase [Anaerolineaceae bacterium]
MIFRKSLSGILIAVLFISFLLFAFEPGNSGVVHAGSDSSAPGEYSQKIDAGLYENLSKRAQSGEPVRVIVKLNVGFDPNIAQLDSIAATVQELNISKAQAKLSYDLLTLNVSAVRRFRDFPYSAMTVDAEALDALLASDQVIEIFEDVPVPVTLSSSIPLINADDAWANGYSGAGQTIAILDTGVDKNHSFLSGKVVEEACFYTTSASYGGTLSMCPGGVPSSTAVGSALPYGGNCPAGKCDHGTHVAGIAAGSGGSFSGVAKNANVIAIQVFSRFDNYCDSPCALSFVSDQMSGLSRVLALKDDYNIAAVNMSLGGGYYNSYCNSDPRKVIIEALKNAGIA